MSGISINPYSNLYDFHGQHFIIDRYKQKYSSCKSGKFPAEFLKQYFFGFFRGRTDAGL